MRVQTRLVYCAFLIGYAHPVFRGKTVFGLQPERGEWLLQDQD